MSIYNNNKTPKKTDWPPVAISVLPDDCCTGVTGEGHIYIKYIYNLYVTLSHDTSAAIIWQ